MEKDIKKLSFSRLSVFNTCKKKFEYEYIRNLRAKKFSFALNTGSLFHKGMEILYKTNSLDEAIKTVNEESEKVDTSAFGQDDYRQYEKDLVMIHGMLQGAYDVFYQRDQEKNVKVLAVEGSYIQPLPDDYSYHFILDLLLEIDGKVCLIEYKTSSRLGDAYFNRLKIDMQTRTMAYLLKNESINVDKIVFRIIKKPGIRIKQTETSNQFLERLQEEFSCNPMEYFIEQEFAFTEKDRDNAMAYLAVNTSDYQIKLLSGFYQQNTSICSIINCPFLPLCNSEDNIDLYESKESEVEETPEE